MSGHEPIETDRLVIREFIPEDWPAFHEYSTHPEVLPFHKFTPQGEDDTRRFLDEMIACQSDSPRRRFEMAITLKSDGRVIGGCGLYLSERSPETAAIGYVLSRSAWGNGYATEAAEALLRMAFCEMGAHRVSTWCDARNGRSASVLERIGMRFEGLFLQDRRHMGEWRDTRFYAILADEWRARSK